jgi:hypothetical protein
MSKEAKEREIREALANIPDEASQIDYAMEKRGCFRHEDDSLFYPIVQEYLTTNLPIEEATEKLLAPMHTAILKDQLGLNMWDLWFSIIHSAKRLPFRDVAGLTKLVDLVSAIKASPPPDAAHKDLFRTLTDFGMCARESMNDSPGCGSGYTLPEAHAYTNMIYFYALLFKSGAAGFWIYCIWEMRSALEDILEDDPPERGHKPGTRIEKFEARVPAAAVFVFAVGKEVYAREEDLTETRPNYGNPGKGGKLWTGKPEFSKERWALWKKRFGEVSELEELSEEVRAIAKEAAEAMDRIERGQVAATRYQETSGRAGKTTYAQTLT